MEESKFFKLVWRFNGLIISIAGILAIIVLLFVSYKLIKDATRERTVNNIVNVAEDTEVKENWTLGSIYSVQGTSVLKAPLQSDQSYSRSYYSKSSTSTRNYLYINTQTYDKYWLFDHTNYLIEKSENIRKGDYSSKAPVIATMFHLVKLDSNTDNHLTVSDHITIAFAKPNGTGYLEVLSGVEKFNSSELISDNEFLMIYQKNGSLYSAVINLQDFSLIEDASLPAVGENK
ncbi:hypothetical protein [Thalassomonas sp. M1454]|uniref:hypothetical protein n=1 Tax=Thalassomonas sp. M1454 TaxID=2594477 RepID=UPI00117DE2B2|nr:hypothetical protein [Thalassomonas sp. M1454]TRX57985.1 hypothetical protein FNN08_00945 [Thalassomonas sp. M1454]